MSFVIGIDTSTTATKAVMIDRSGTVVGVGIATYDYQMPQPLWSEQDPDLWWQATMTAIGRLMSETHASPDDVDAIGLTGQMHGSVLLDDNLEPVRPAILWNDQRTQEECDELRSRVGFERLVNTTGNDALTGFTAPKLLWVRNHEPDAWGRTKHVLLPKDYVRLRLSDRLAVDAAGGSGTILFNLASRTWSRSILETLDLDPDLFSPVYEGPEITGSLSSTAAECVGLRAGIPVVAGGGDQAANAVGVGAVTPGVVALSLGTSGVVFATTEGPQIDPRGRVHAFCHAVPDRWHMMGVMLSAAGSLRWLRDTFTPGRPFEDLLAPANSVAPGSEGLLFLPYLTGERTPHPDPLAKGALVGVTARHSMPHITRAVLEGVAFGLRDGLDLMIETGLTPPNQVRASGGGIRSALWRQILADVLGAEIATMRTEEGAAYGAGLLASVGAGWFDTVEEACESSVVTTVVAEPSPDAELYKGVHDRYRSLYPALAPVFHAG